VLEEIDDELTSIRKMVEQPGEREDGPTSVNVEDKEISIGEVPIAVPQEEKLQEQVQVQREKPKISKRKQKRRRVTSYLSNISKQVEK
jgi:hypothetical protein